MKKQQETRTPFSELEIIFRNGEDIKDYVFVLVGIWAASLNFDYYTSEYFQAESCSSDDWEPSLISKKRNDFIEMELKGLSEEIVKIKDGLKLYHVNTNPRNINNAIQTIWGKELPYFDHLERWKSNKSYSERTAIISLHFESVKLDEMLYYLCFIYLDLLRVREFLLSKFEKISSPKNDVEKHEKTLTIPNIENKTNSTDSILNSPEIAYLQYYLRTSKDYKDGQKNKGDIHKEFAQMGGGKSVKNVEIFFNKINLNEGVRLSNPDKIERVIKYIKSYLPQFSASISLAETELSLAKNKL